MVPRVALDNVNIKIDDTTVSVMDFTSGLNWQEKTLTLKPTSLKGLLIALPKVAEVAQEEVVEPKIENPQPDEKPLGETLKDLFSRPVLPEMTDVHLPLNLNIEEFKGEQLRVTGDTDITVNTMLLKVSSIDGNTKLDALDIDSNQGIVNASGTAQLSDNWPVDITLNSTLNVEDGHSGNSLAVLMPLSVSSPRQLMACCQSSNALSSVLPSSAATVSLSRLTCCSLPRTAGDWR